MLRSLLLGFSGTSSVGGCLLALTVGRESDALIENRSGVAA